MLKIHSIETFWTNEWPWIRTVFFLQWCEFKCLYCHNPDTIPTKWWKLTTNEQLLEIVEKNKIYFGNKGGVTVSGWEPLLQAKELISFFKELKNRWFNITVDTNGYLMNDDVMELLKYTDLVLLDLKHLDDEKHKILTGVSNKNVLNFLDYLENNNIKFWIRHVLVPTYTDDEKHIESIWKYLKNFKYLERLEILPYHTLWKYKWKELWLDYKLENIEPPSRENLDNTKNTLQKYIKNVYVRG